MQPYPRAPDLVWPGHLHGTGCLSARAVGTGFPTVGLQLWLGPGCGWSWVLFTPARCGWGLGWVCLGSVCGVVPLLPAFCGVRGWALVSACFRDLCGFVRVSLAPRRFRFRCAVWACVLGPGLGCAPPFLAGLSGCVFCAFFFFPVAWCPCPGPCGLSPRLLSFGLDCWLFFFFFVCLFRCPFSRWAAVPGLVLPVLAGWSPCACLGVLSSVPSGWGVRPPSALLAGGLVAVGLFFFFFARPAPSFFLGGGGVVCGVWQWCIGGVVAGVWCGWFLATPGGGSCVLLPATPGWVSLPLVVGGPRHSWLGSACGGGVWCVVCGVWRWCVGGVVAGVWCGWSLATPGGGSCVLLPATPGWVSLALVVGGPRHSWLGSACGGGVWCVVCGGGVSVGLWLVCGVVGPSPLLAVVPVCYSPPLLAGFRCRWWWAVPATPGWGPPAASLCGVWRWCVVGVVVGVWCGLSLATPGGGPCVLLPATPGWVSLQVVVGGPRHSWLGSVGGGGVWCVVCGVWCVVGVPRHSWRRFLCATPRHSWLGFAAAGGGWSPPLLAGVRWRRWCVVCGVWCVVCCWGPSPLLAEVPVCYSPPLLAGLRCRWWWAVPATPGWGPLAAVVCVLCSAGSGGPASRARSGAPHLFLWPLCLSALLGPLRAGVAPLSFAAVAVPRWLFFWASRCLARASFVSPAWPLAALWWLLPPPPLCVSRFSSLLLVALVFFFSPSSSSSVRPRCLRLSLVSGPGCPGPRRLRCLFCWPSASRLSVRLSLFRAFRLAVGCFRVVAAPPPPPPFLSRGFRSCRWVLCAVLCCASLGAVLRRAAARCVARCCAVVCCVALVWCRCLLRRALWRGPLPCGPVLCGAVFCAVCSVLCVFCRRAVVRAVVRRSALCCVCRGVLCCAFRLLSVLCGAVLRCAGALALCCSCGVCRCWRLVLWCAAVCCAVSCGVPWCGAGSGGPWLSAGGVFRCRCPCLAAWSASLWLVWFAVVPCFPVSCSVVLCCRVVLCCCALLSCWCAVGACFALLWAVVLCCVVLLVGCAVFGPVVVSACCGALFLALCVPCLLRSVRCGALLCWLWCPASLCRVLWRCAVVWCCAVVLCCRFAVLFVFALPSCGLSCGACVVCAVVGASCCGVSLCVVVSPWAFCGVVVLLLCVVVSCCAVRCPVVSCALCRVLRGCAVLRCCASWLCCAVVCAAGVCFVLFSFAKNPCRFSVPLKTLFFFFAFEKKIKLYTTQHTRVQQDHVRCCALRVTRRS